jgi:pimeloyl-ACP methyl ester carboxylesterase
MNGSAAPAPQSATRFTRVRWCGREDRIEHVWIGAQRRAAPLLVFLHEGLGSVAMWRDFPHALCAAAGCRGLVYSRRGHGQSTPRASHERWPVEFLHDQALEFLPRLFEALELDAAVDRPWFYGHSEGGSIALIHAAVRPAQVAGLVVAAPHTFVEDTTIASIERARDAYRTTDLRSRLARHHADPDSAFWGWNDVWLDPAFRRFDIRALLPAIRCPLLAIQGHDDEYGSMAQLEAIARAVPQAELLRLDDCGHSPHRDQPAALLSAVADFIGRQQAAARRPSAATDTR